MDVNAIFDAKYDCIGTDAAPQPSSIAETVLAAGCHCAFRQHFTEWKVGSRLCTSGANLLTRLMIRPTPLLRLAAAAIHWGHGSLSGHAPMVADVVGVYAQRVPPADYVLHGKGVRSSVPWRRFVLLATLASENKESEMARRSDPSEREGLAAFKAALDELKSQHMPVWQDVAARAWLLTTRPAQADTQRAELGEICELLVASINQAICTAVPGRSGKRKQTILQPSRLARKWTLARVAIHQAAQAIRVQEAPRQAFRVTLAAAKAWRAACGAHAAAHPECGLGPHAKTRIRCPPMISKALVAWRVETRDIVGRAWTLMAHRLHRQPLKSGKASALSERRQAHRSGNVARWLQLLVGSPAPTYPAALEAPHAASPEDRVTAAAKLLVSKYGTRRWDAHERCPFVECYTRIRPVGAEADSSPWSTCLTMRSTLRRQPGNRACRQWTLATWRAHWMLLKNNSCGRRSETARRANPSSRSQPLSSSASQRRKPRRPSWKPWSALVSRPLG